MITIRQGDDLRGVSLHNHSDWSDGKFRMVEMCLAARDAGIRTFGLSDHFVLHPNASVGKVDWSMKPDMLPEYVAAVKKLRDELQGPSFRLLVGVEVDYFEENIAEVEERISGVGLDYAIGSVHYSGTFPIDCCAEDWHGLSQARIDEIWHDYWRKLLGAARCGAFQVIGHLDLPKKFCFMPSYDYADEALAVLDAVAGTGKAIELNTAGWYKDCREQYPSMRFLEEARRRGIPVVVSADAHDVAHVARGFGKAWEMLRMHE